MITLTVAAACNKMKFVMGLGHLQHVPDKEGQKSQLITTLAWSICEWYTPA